MLRVREKIAYGLGDTASNIVFQTVMLFLSFFYTDIFGISPAIVGTLFLVVRIFDAVTDPLMGAITDRTTSKHGKFRPYILWLSIPFAICSILAFTTPDLSDQGKVIYAFVTYGLLMAGYTAINIPYSALGGVLTADPKERVSVQSYRFFFGMLGGLLVTAMTLPLVDFLGDGDKAKGYQLTITAMSLLGVVLFFLCFKGTKERISPPEEQKSTITEDMKSLLKNDQWRVLCMAAFFLLTGLVLRTTLSIYYVKYFLGREDLITLFVTLGMLANIAGVSLAQPLAKKVCKIKAYITLQVIASILCACSYFVGSDDLVAAFTLYILWNFTLQMATPLLWAKMADTVDYGQWKTGIRVTGMVYSAIVFFIKMGLALGGAIAGWLLAYYNYQADTVQSAETLEGLVLSFSLYPAIATLIVAFIMRWYTLNDQQIEQIQSEIETVKA